MIEAVDQYLGAEPHLQRPPPNAEIPAGTYRIDQFPEYLQLARPLDLLEALGRGQSVL